jgi:acyl-CoA hydrolase
LAEPAAQHFGGKVHGGAVMKWIDPAAYACAAGWSGKYCITVYAVGIRFVKPILVGNLVEVAAKVIDTQVATDKGKRRISARLCVELDGNA